MHRQGCRSVQVCFFRYCAFLFGCACPDRHFKTAEGQFGTVFARPVQQDDFRREFFAQKCVDIVDAPFLIEGKYAGKRLHDRHVETQIVVVFPVDAVTCGNVRRIVLKMVSPPKPESKMPIGCVFIFLLYNFVAV